MLMLSTYGEYTAEEIKLKRIRESIVTFQGLRRRAKCRKLRKRYADLIAKYRLAEQKLLNVKS
jgi:hypothetical protein